MDFKIKKLIYFLEKNLKVFLDLRLNSQQKRFMKSVLSD